MNLIKTIFVWIALMLFYVNINAQCDYSDDITTFPAFTHTNNLIPPYYQTSTGGWVAEDYCRHVAGSEELCLFGGPIASYKRGILRSPSFPNAFPDGCAEIRLFYKPYSNAVKLKLEIKQGANTLWSDVIDAIDNTVWHEYSATVNITGTFQLIIDNITNGLDQIPGDDIYIKNICIADCAPSLDQAIPEFTISGREKSENLYWEAATVGMDIDSDTEGASLYYTLDGSDPTAESTLYEAPFDLTATTQVKAIAILGDQQSLVADTLISVAGPQSAALPHTETFAGSLGDWYSYSATGDNQVWYAGEESEQTFAKMSGADANENIYVNEDWLISPALTAGEGRSIAFSFKSALLFPGEPLALKYSTDYFGVGNPTTATWTDISNLAFLPTGEDEWTESGEIRIDTVLPVRFAFVYTSTATDAADWKVGNILAREVTVSTTDETAPTGPTGLTAGEVTETTIALSWTASTDNIAVAGYYVYLNGDSIDRVTETSYTFTDLTAATEYTLAVEAFDDAGNRSAKETYVVSTTDETAPTVPTGLTAGEVTETTIALSWTASTDNIAVAGYYVYLNGDSIDTVEGTSYTVSGLTAATEYTLAVEAFDDAGNRSGRASITQSTLNRTGIPGIDESIRSVYPNPFDDYIVIESAVNEKAVIGDISGRTVLTAELKPGNNRIATSALPQGVYLVKHDSLIEKRVKN